MARMIPRWTTDDAPASERRVFEKIERDPAASSWTVLHALGLAQKPTGPYGEIDFVVIAPGEGIVCLEVKGGRVSCENGIWRTENRLGGVSQLKKSPFMQARDNMFALRGAIRKHFGDRAAESQCPMGYAVVFPDVTCPPLPLSPEVARRRSSIATTCRNPSPIRWCAAPGTHVGNSAVEDRPSRFPGP